MAAAKLTSKGQITLPKEVREALHVRVGDRVNFRVKPDRTVVVESGKIDLMSLKGILTPKVKGVTIEMMNEAIRKGGTRL